MPQVQQFQDHIIDLGILSAMPEVSWDAVIGLHDVKRLVREKLVILPMRPDNPANSLFPWRSVLLYGPPRTGKTLLAKAIAAECKRPFIHISASLILSQFGDNSQSVVSSLFALSEEIAPSVIFIDEIDDLASQKNNEIMRAMKGEILLNLEKHDSRIGIGVFVFASTTVPWDLDDAWLRRFQKRVYVGLPDKEARLGLLQMNLKNRASMKMDLEEWAGKLDGYSSGDISNLCKDAMQMVFVEQTKMLETDDWMRMSVSDAQITVTNEAFEKVIGFRKSSVEQATLRRYEEWKRQKGAT
jgi:katanin p60 ATPase-containing subunit A1